MIKLNINYIDEIDNWAYDTPYTQIDLLIWYLEKLKLITPIQSGFSKQRSTTDQLVRLETFVHEAFVNK